ncbi:LysM peptidoglycan-binding domain-containing protein [Sutcliffiella cohnii]
MMSYKFLSLPQLSDKRSELPNRGNFAKRNTALRNLVRVWHHSLTRKHLGGSNARGFANYHVHSLGWERIGYTFVIEPMNIVDTPNGRRARIVYANNITDRSYHVGTSNDSSLGICVAGDYRYDDLDAATIASMVDLHRALIQDNIGRNDKSHHEMPGYAWKVCCVFDYRKALSTSPHSPVIEADLPDTYTVQQGDTLWSLANNDDRFTVEDLMRWNNIENPRNLRVGQKLTFRPPTTSAPTTPPTRATVKWSGTVKSPGLNVRKGPSINFPIVRVLNNGDVVDVYEESNGWLNIGNGQWVSNVGGKYVTKRTNAGRRYLNLKPSINAWRVYPLNRAAVRGNEIGFLNPQKFGGLSYEILGNPMSNVYTIQTANFGRVNIFASNSTASTITNRPTY